MVKEQEKFIEKFNERKILQKTKIPNLKSKWTNPIDKANYVKQTLIDNFHIIETKKLISIVSRINCYRKSEIKSLTDDERLLYDLLLRFNLHPRAVYDWLTITIMPKKIKDQLRKRKIKIVDALKIFNDWKRNYNSITNNLMRDIKISIRGL